MIFFFSVGNSSSIAFITCQRISSVLRLPSMRASPVQRVLSVNIQYKPLFPPPIRANRVHTINLHVQHRSSRHPTEIIAVSSSSTCLFYCALQQTEQSLRNHEYQKQQQKNAATNKHQRQQWSVRIFNRGFIHGHFFLLGIFKTESQHDALTQGAN